MASIVLTREEQRLLNVARRRWKAMVSAHARLQEAGFTVNDIVGLQNPNSYRVSKSVNIPMSEG